MIDFAGGRLPALYTHQIAGIEALVKWDEPSVGRVCEGCFALFDEMGAGKTRQVIEAAQYLIRTGQIDRVLVVTPAGVRSVWFDQTFGELTKYLWDSSTAQVTEFHSRLQTWLWQERASQSKWMITNYEFIRSKNRLTQLLQFCTPKTLIVLDEATAIKWYRTEQFKACWQLRKRCGWVWLLTGTPVANSPGDMFALGQMMDPAILGCSSWFHFRARYAIMGGWQQKQIIGWRDIDDMQRRFAPYVLRRLKVDCLDLPEKLPPVTLSTPLSPATWAAYKAMRDDCVTWLSNATVSQAPQAITKVMRLSQITGGFLGGVEEMALDDGADIAGTRPEGIPFEHEPEDAPTGPVAAVQEIGREKLDAFFDWLDSRLQEDRAFKCVVWSRFRPELQRAVRETKARYPDLQVGVIAGGFKKSDREHALRLMDPRTCPDGPAVVFGNPQSGGLGLNMTAADCMFRLSSDYSHFKRAQSEDRIHRPGQVKRTSYFDLVATGPQGQRTVDHTILAALLKKDDLATMTTSAWIHELTQE